MAAVAHCTAWHSVALPSFAWHGSAWHGVRGTAWHSMAHQEQGNRGTELGMAQGLPRRAVPRHAVPFCAGPYCAMPCPSTHAQDQLRTGALGRGRSSAVPSGASWGPRAALAPPAPRPHESPMSNAAEVGGIPTRLWGAWPAPAPPRSAPWPRHSPGQVLAAPPGRPWRSQSLPWHGCGGLV